MYAVNFGGSPERPVLFKKPVELLPISDQAKKARPILEADPNYPRLREIWAPFLRDNTILSQLCELTFVKLHPNVRRPYLDMIQYYINKIPEERREMHFSPEGMFGRLLEYKRARKIGRSLKSPAFLFYACNGNIPSWALTRAKDSGRLMLQFLASANRQKSNADEKDQAKALGVKDANGDLAQYLGRNPTVYCIYGPGDCQKEIERLRAVVESGRKVTVVIIDCSMDMLRESSKNLKAAFGDNVEIVRIHKKFEELKNLPDKNRYKQLAEQPGVVNICYGNTVTNNPPKYTADLFGGIIRPGHIAEIGIAKTGDYNKLISQFLTPEGRATRSAAMRAVGFSDEDIASMNFGVRISEVLERKGAQAKIPVLQTYFFLPEGSETIEAGLIKLEELEPFVVSQRYILNHLRFRHIFGDGGFRTLLHHEGKESRIYQEMKV
ncbi:MAG: hypothetical protein PHE48_02540 [Candidatus Daviesbacteria bacterium]|nr:hypothetical protein [Candidatus Daviesbacteria bacterium]